MNGCTPFCYATGFSIEDRLSKKYTILKTNELWKMCDFQMIFIRLNPPFDITYLTIVHFLTFIDQTKTLIVNNPFAFQTTSEKLIPLHFSEFIPETVMTTNFALVEDFLEQHKQIVLKPMHSYGSDDIFLINKEDCNLKYIFANLLQKYKNCPIIVQRFIENVKKGDKRILIVDDEVLGSFFRIPKENSILSGTIHGASLAISKLTDKENRIVDNVKRFMKQNKIYFSGIDVIDECLTEVNFTSPAGLPILIELTKIDYGKISWGLIEKIYDREVGNIN